MTAGDGKRISDRGVYAVYADVTFVDALNGTRQSVSIETGEKIGAKFPGNLKAEGYTFVGCTPRRRAATRLALTA